MPQAVVAVISAVATVGFQAAAAAGISITAMTTATAFAIGAGVIAVGALAANKLMSSLYEMPKMDTDASRQRTVRSTIEPQKIIYGEALVSGPIAFVGVYGSKNRVLAHAVALAGHEVNAITDIHFDNEVIDNSLIDGNGFVTSGTFGPIGNNQFNDQGGVNFGFNICKINKHLGASGQTVDADLDSAFGSIDSSHKGTGIAYITTHWLLKDDSQEIWDKYTPTNIKALVEGRKVYDPRTDLTAYSDNPALCVADYLTNAEFGMGISSSRIDWNSVTAAANACDVLVDTPDGTDSQKRFTCNGILFATDTHKTNINKLLSSMNGLLTYTNGTFVIRAGVYEAPTVSLNENDLIGGVSVKTSVERSDRFNTITGTFIDPTQNHKATEFPEVFTTAARDRDNGNVLTKNIQLPMTNDRYMAQRIAHKLVQQSDQQKVVTFPTNLTGMDVAVGDRVEISLSEFGWVDKVFICLGWTLNDSGNGGINLILREDDAGSYADPAVGEYSTITATGQIVEGFRGVPDPQNLSATSFNNYIQLNWTNPDNMNDVLFIEVFASPVSAWSETFTATSGQTVFVYDRDFTVDDTFDVKLDGVALVQSTDFTVDLETKTLTLTTGATAGDILEIFNRVKIGETDGTQFVHDAATPADSISPDDTRYYWIRARAYSTGETALSVSDRNPDNDVSTVFATVGRVDFLNVSGDVVQTGDTSRTLIDRLSDIISPDDFGAVGDGIEDDTEALKALAAWVYSISTELDTSYRKGHVSIRFPARRLYKITDTIDFGGEAKDDGSGAVQTGLRVHFDFNNCEIAPAPHPDTGVVSSALRMWGDNSSWKNLKVNYARYCTVDEVYQYQPTAIFVGPDPADMSTRFASNSFSTYENIQVFDAYNGFELEADTVALFKVTWRQCDAKKCLNWGYYLNSQPVVGASTTNTFQQCHVAARLVTADYGRVRIDEDFTATEGQSVFTYTQEFLSSDDPIVVVEGETFTRSLFANYLEIGRTYLIINLGDADWNAIAGTTGVTYSVGDIITPVAKGAANTTGRVGDFSVDLDLKTITLAVPRTSGDQVNIYGVYECIQTHVPDSTNKAGLGANWQDYWFSLTNAESAPATTYPDWTTSTTRYYEDGKGWYLYGFGSTGFIGQCAIDGTNNRVAGNGITCLQFGLTISGGFHWEAPKLIANDNPLMLVQNASLNIDHMYIPAPYFANEGNNVFIGGINSRMITVNEMRVVQAQMARGNRYLIDASGFGTVTTGAGINPEEVKNAPSSNVHGAYDVQRNITARPMRRDLGQDFGGSNSTVTPATWQSGTTFSHNVTSGGSFTLNLTKDPERGSEYRAFCYNSAGGATANVTASSTDGATIIGPTVAKGGETLVAHKTGNSFWYTRIEYNQHYGDFVDVDALVVGQNYRIYSLGNTTQTEWNTIAGTTGVTYAVNDIITPVQQGGAGSTGRVGELYIGDTKLESVTNTLPSASRYEGHVIRVGDDASYGDVLAFSDGTDWLRSNDLNPVNSTGVTYIDTTNGRLGVNNSAPVNQLSVGAIEASSGDQLGTVGIKSDANDKALMLQENVGTEQWEIGVDVDGDLNFYNSGSTEPTVSFLDNNTIEIAVTGIKHVGTGNTGVTLYGHTDSDGVSGSSGFTAIYGGDDYNTGGGFVTYGQDHPNKAGETWFYYSGFSQRMVIKDAAVLFYNTAAIEGMRWDASAQRLGLGTSSPESPLTVSRLRNDWSGVAPVGSTGLFVQGIGIGLFAELQPASITLGSGNQATFCGLYFADTDDADVGAILYSHADDVMQVRVSGSEAMRIDSSGNVGIGTTNPQNVLDLGNATNGRGIAWGGGGGTAHYNTIWSEYSTASIIIGAGLKGSDTSATFLNPFTGTYGYAAIELDSFSDDGIKFYTAADSSRTKDAAITPNERVRIDTNGSFLVGTTTLNVYNGTTTGTAITQSGYVFIGKSGDAPLWVNRISNDGSIINLRKDGTTVGSIGSRSGSFSYIDLAPSLAGLTGSSTGGGSILPSIGTTITDASISLGYSAGRFKDLYLSGTAYLDSDAVINSYAIGRGSGGSSTNTVFGLEALDNNTTGTQNVAIGKEALRYNTTGYSNAAVGSEALKNNTTGYINTASGAYSLRYNTTGFGNTSFGYAALQNNIYGNYNTAVGDRASNSNTSGVYNVSVGRYALNENTTGGYNVAIGGFSLRRNNANYNTAVGYATLHENTTGSQNTALGMYSLYYTTSGAQNTATGMYAGYLNTTGNYNVFNGRQAGNNNTTGSFNTLVGYTAGNNLTTGSNNTIIGAIGGTAGLSDTIIIGAGATERIRCDSSGNWGIGTSSPAGIQGGNVLEVSNATGSEVIVFRDDGSTETNDFCGGFVIGNRDASGTPNHYAGMWADTDSFGQMTLQFAGGRDKYESGTADMVIDVSGNVGINTLSPATNLEVVGVIRASDGTEYTQIRDYGIEINRANGYLWPTSAFNGSANLNIGASGSLWNVVSIASDNSFQITDGTDKRFEVQAGADAIFYDNVGVEGMRWDSSAQRLGIGVSAPSAKLDISAVLYSINQNGGIRIGDTGGNWNAGVKVKSDGSGNPRLAFEGTSGNEELSIASGKIGIRTSVPNDTLQINGDLSVTASDGAYTASYYAKLKSQYGPNPLALESRLGDVIQASNYGSELTFLTGSASTVERLKITNSGNVGIGDSSPVDRLTVSRLGSSWAGVTPNAITTGFFHSGTTNDSSGSAITIAGGDTATNAIYFSDEADNDVGAILYSNADDFMAFRAGGSERVRVTSSGNVGIGTSSPTEKLDVNGTVKATAFSGSGASLTNVNAATLDSLDSTQFLRSDTSDVMNGNLTVTNDLTAGESFFGATSYKVRINSTSSTGILEFNSTNGIIGNAGAVLGLSANSTQIVDVRAAAMQPTTDNVTDLGASTKRWDNIYATNALIQTSDGAEKQDVEALSDAELRVAQSIKGLIRKFRFKSSVAEKGDDARIHFGVIAQDVRAAFEAEGLDATQYGCFCADVDEDGNERLGIRYDELLAFVITAL